MRDNKILRAIIVLLLVLIILAILGWWLLLKPAPPMSTQDPVKNFNYGSIGNEESNGLPYWIWRVLPKVFPDHLPGNQDGYGSLGFYWESGSELPVGFSKRALGVIPRVAFNCALCHQGSYRLLGEHKSTLVTGGAGNRVRPQSYQRFLFKVAADERFNARRLMQEIKSIYDMPLWERIIYRYLLIPFTRKAILKNAETFAWMETRPDWGIGRIDPFNPVKFGILKIPVDATIGNSDMMPLWDFEHVINRKDSIYALHWNGLNTNLHEVVVSGAIGDGMTYKSYGDVYDNIMMRENFSRLQKPPVSPFNSHRDKNDPYYVSQASVNRGKRLYNQYCADCHEVTGSQFRKVISIHEVATDRHRIDMWTDQATQRYMDYEKDTAEWNFKHWQNVNGYVATELTGLWLKGPYLHNGSVPTLKDLLKPVKERPVAYCRGSDTVDPVNGGFMAPLHKQNCKGFYFDTQVKGNGNQGHEYGTTLADNDKADLLSYLKTR